jgi:tRNA(fMet)-specific endonuclease VapC
VIRYILDTSVCVEILRGRADNAVNRIRECADDEIGISIITLAELQYGTARSNRPEHHAEVVIDFVTPLVVLPFDAEAAKVYGEVRAALERAGTPIGPLDTLIASHAISVNAAIVTNNVREFQRVAGLHVENWLG